MNLCIFCLRSAQSEPWCTDNPGNGCTYGFHHELVVGIAEEPEVKKVQTIKVDKKLCMKCKLHPANPKFKTNNCEHEFAT
jgi:hypothetical protein